MKNFTMRIAQVMAILVFLTTSEITAQIYPADNVELEEIVISFEVPKAVVSDIFVMYNGSTVYLPLVKVFSLLDINVEADFLQRKIEGFYLSKDKRFKFDMNKNQIEVFGEEIPYLASNFYFGENDLYIKLDAFNQIFDLNADFDFTLLRVFLRLDENFPVYQKLKRKIAREKLEKEEIALKDVIDIDYSRQYLSGGTLDWVMSANPVGGRNKHFYNLRFGGMTLGGDLMVSTGGSFGNEDSQIFEKDQLSYKWHYVFNENKYITQAEIGDVSGGGALSRTLDGVVVTNRPQVRRKFFQTIYIKDFIGPGWEVELFIDNKLADFVLTSADGMYEFTTDIYYGSTNIELRMYGPNGEYQIKEHMERVPFNLIPRGEFEYAIAAGEGFENQQQKNFIQTNSLYGLSNKITLGLSSELPLEPEENEKPLFGLDATYQIVGNMTFNSAIIPTYVKKARLNYSLPSKLNLNVAFSKYDVNLSKNPLSLNYNVQFSVSSPLKIFGQNIGLRYNVSHDSYELASTTNMNYGFNISANPIYLTYIGQYKMNNSEYQDENSIASQILFSTNLIRLFRPQFKVDYNHSTGQLEKYGCFFAKRIFRTSQLTFSYERNNFSKSNTFMVTINLLQPFADFTSRVVKNDYSVSYNQMQKGSVRYDSQNSTFHFDRRNSIGFGAAIVKPFLDDNYNGVMDEGDEYLEGLRAKIKGARVNVTGSSTQRQYFYNNLQPYEEYTIQIDQYSLDNPMLKPTHENYKVKVNPNVVTSIKVPIVTASELSGKVERKLGDIVSGIGGFKVYVMNLSKEFVVELPTFNSGDFYYLGLIPGSYRAYLDPKELDKYGYVSNPPYIEFEIKPTTGGTFVEGINFLLETKETAVDSEK
ncbi:MAG: hypothetical protein DWP97_03255 [Calditrichaeota bacterium]|nr:MAG: hypothetical protein DWP97_03255 [Calditrichota bacterium]